MGQVLHGCARITETIRRAIQNSKESIAKLSKCYNLKPKTIIKWRKRSFTKDAGMGPKHPRSTVLTLEEEAIIVAFRKHTLLPLDECLYALQTSIPHLSRSSLHRCLQRHNISRLPDVDGEVKSRKKFKQYPIGYFHIDIAEVRTEEGKLYLFVAIDRTSKFTYVELHKSATKPIAAEFLGNLIRILPYKIHTIFTDNGIQFTNQKRHKHAFQHIFDRVCEENNIEHRLTKVSHYWTNGQVERMNKTLKNATVKKYYYRSHQQLKEYLYDFVMAYNYAKRLKALRGLTPFEFICSQLTKSPELFIIDPHHHTLEPYILYSTLILVSGQPLSLQKLYFSSEESYIVTMDKIIIKKFGGTSLTDLNRVANLIKNDIEKGCNVIVVVSAVAGFTDQMAFQARQISNLSCRQELSEYDVMLSAGEQISCGLLAITLQSIGVNAKSWLAWQLPIVTDDFYSESKIKTIKIDRVKRSFAEGYTAAIIAGFQGINDDRITTFGRGGSDISAVAFTVAFGVRTCEIFTDIDGIYTADPRIVPKACKLKFISYDEMLEMSSSGAKILHNRSVQLAMKHNIKVQVLSTFKEVEGTTVLHKRDALERYLITGIAYSTNEALVTFTNLANNLRTLRDIVGANVKIDMIHGSSFVISKFDIDLMEKLLNKNENYAINDNVAKISIIGIGVMSNTEVMHRTLKVLSEKKIEILAITTSEIKISIIVQKEYVVALVKDLHTEYELDMQH